MPRARVRCTSASTPLLWSVTSRTRAACRLTRNTCPTMPSGTSHAAPAPGDGAAEGGSGALERRHQLEEGASERVGAARGAAAAHDQRCPDDEAERHGEHDAVATDVVQRYRGPVRCSRPPGAPRP